MAVRFISFQSNVSIRIKMDINPVLIATINLISATTATVAATCQRRQRRRKNKRKWIKEWRLDRAHNSQFTLVHEQYRLIDKDFYRRYLRMDENCFKELLDYIRPYLTKQSTSLREPIPPEESLSATLRYLATGNSFISMDMETKLSQPFLTQTIPKCCFLIFQHLKDIYMKFPSSIEEWEDIAAGFNNRWQFPLCLGALDGKHIEFRASKKEDVLYYNYKRFHSVVLLAMCDSKYRFTFADIGGIGRNSDSGTLNQSHLRTIIQHARTYFPPDKNIGNDRLLPYCIIGDDAFPLEKHIMKPYSYSTQDPKEIYYNFRLSRARQTIECAFGILANRFKVLQNIINLCPEKVNFVIGACCVLHNFLITHETENSSFSNGPNTSPSATHPADVRTEDEEVSASAKRIRDEFAAYFFEEGHLTEQA